MDLEKAISMIPICTGKKDSAEFINACEIAIKEVVDADKPVLLKIITSKLTGNALEVTKYRELDTWAAIKSILEGAFEQKISERALSAALSAARMTEGESVTKFAARIEELYYKICEASTVGLTKPEALTLKNSWRRQAMNAFMTGLPEHLYTVLKSRNPESLEQCFKVAVDEDLEYRSRLEMRKMQGNVQNHNIQAGSSNAEKQQTDNNKNMFNRGGNNGRNNNFNYANRYDNNNRNGY
ncbi:Atp-dependent dna helicase, partial [Thalictrum thalictroides]